jgi:hypothetical protein
MAAAQISIVSASKVDASSLAAHDVLVVLYVSLPGASASIKSLGLAEDFAKLAAIDGAFGPASVVFSAGAPGQRIVLAPVGSVAADVDDARRFAEAGKAAFAKVRALKATKPIVVVEVPSDELFKYAAEVAVLGALQVNSSVSQDVCNAF